MNPDLRRLPAALALAAALLAAPAAAQLPAPPASAPGLLAAGGYAAVTLRVSPGDSVDSDPELNEAAVALLLSGTPWRRLSYFAEIEAASVSRETFTGREDERWLEVERAYLELAASDALRLRVGRFLTPVGQWNEVHAAPLTWTAGRPLTTYRAFAKSTTGAMVAGQFALGPRDAGYAVWVAPGIAPEGEGEESTFLRAAGARGAFELVRGLHVGFSSAGIRASRRAGGPEPDGDDQGPEDADDRLEDRETRALMGADLSWTLGGFRLLSEATWLSASKDEPAERGGFVQAAVPVARGLHLVGRAEAYDPVASGPLRIYTAGLNWRPGSRLALKVERQATSRPSRRVADGWLVSLSGLF